MKNIPQRHHSTMAYLWQQYSQHPRALAFSASSHAEWLAWRHELRDKLSECLGKFPAERCNLSPRVVETIDQELYRQEKVYFYSEPGVAVPCYVLTPRNVQPPYRPVIAVHGHGSGGASLLLGIARGKKERAQMQKYNCDYAHQLARNGFMVFVPVQRALGERTEQEPTYSTRSGLDEKSCEMVSAVSLLFGKTLIGLRVWDLMRTIDYIRSRSEPLVDKVGCVGLSGGGSTTLYAAALDERIRLAVIAGALCTYRASIMSIVHCPDNYVPGILRYGEISDVAGLIAPRPLLIESGLADDIFPIAGVRQAYRELKRVYALLRAADHLDRDFYPGGHKFGGRKTYNWLTRWFAQA
jgi:dienelactone hydrolase